MLYNEDDKRVRVCVLQTVMPEHQQCLWSKHEKEWSPNGIPGISVVIAKQ